MFETLSYYDYSKEIFRWLYSVNLKFRILLYTNAYALKHVISVQEKSIGVFLENTTYQILELPFEIPDDKYPTSPIVRFINEKQAIVV